jgi:hypothetical protein
MLVFIRATIQGQYGKVSFVDFRPYQRISGRRVESMRMPNLIFVFAAFAVPVRPAAVSVTWGDLVRVADVGTITHGDTFYTATGAVGEIYATENDSASPCSTNIGLLAQSSNLHTLTCLNSLPGLSNGNKAFGLCANDAIDSYPKSSGLVAYNNKIILPTHCQLGGPPWSTTQETLNISPINDPAGAGKHWFRVQDNYPVSGASCVAGTITLTTAPQSLAAGDLVIVSGVNPTGYNGTYFALPGTNATQVKYAATCPGPYISGGAMLGPGSTGGTAPSVAMWPGTPTNSNSLKFIQYCPNNVGCASTVDNSDSYLNGLSNGPSYGNLYAFHVLKSDMDDSPGDPTRYQYWAGESKFSSTTSDASPIQCIESGVASNCGGVVGITYITDAELTGGGVYIMTSQAGTTGAMVTEVFWADHFYGPYTLVSTQPQAFAVNAPFLIREASCADDTITLITGPQTISVGDRVTVSGVDPTGYNGTFTSIRGTNATTLKYSVKCSGAYVSGGTVIRSVDLQWPSPVASSYRRISSRPYLGKITIQMSGAYYEGAEYALYQQDILISNVVPGFVRPPLIPVRK